MISRSTGRTKRHGAAFRAVTVAAMSAASFGVIAGATSAAASAQVKGHATKAKYTIALIPGLTTDPFYITMHAGALAEAKKLGVNLIWQGGSTFSPTTQIPAVNTVFAEHPDALIIAPTDVKALKAPIQKFVKAGIPVVAADTTITDTSLLTAQITSDNLQGGKLAAETIAKLAHYKGDVMVDNVQPGVSTTDARQAGFLAQIKKYPNMKVVATDYNDDSPSTAETQVRTVLLAHPDLVGVFATNIYGASGAGKAITTAGKAGKVFVAAYDAEPDTVKDLESGAINVLVIQQPALEGKLAVEYAYDKLTGKTSLIPKGVVKEPNVVATTQDAKQYQKYFYKTTA